MLAELVALVLALWSAASPAAVRSPDARAIAEAAAQAVLDDAEHAPALGSHAEDLAAMAEWARLESGLQRAPRPQSWDARAGISCGPWQEPCPFVARADLRGQARYWLELLHRGAVICPESPGAPLSGGCHGAGRRLSNARLARARALLSALVAP
jgi:hypothetical protein